MPNRDLKIVVLMLMAGVQKQQLEGKAESHPAGQVQRRYFFVILGIGRKVNVKELYSSASEPNDVFFKLVDK